MAEEEKEQDLPDMSEFEATAPASNNHKDMWLFLIIIDVVLLCIFGFFLYKNLSTKLLSPSVEPFPLSIEETIVMDNEAVPFVPSDKKEAFVATLPVEEVEAFPAVAEPVQEVVPQELKVVENEKPALTVEKTPVQEDVSAKATVPAEKRESVIIKGSSTSKYRQVTFRYFGKAKEAAVVGGFTMTKPRAMTQKNGVWETTLSISPGTYKYLLVIDGKQQTDPYAEEKNGRSILVVK